MYKIIIAEDEKQFRERMAKHINESDTEYEVIAEAEDGLQAVELVEKLRPDILLTDICMPKMDGLDLIRKIREIDQDMPIVVVSGYDEFEYAREAMSMGVREYLLKPFLPKKLFEVLDRTKELIDEKMRRDENLQNMSIELQKNLAYSRERFFRSLLEGKIGKQELEVTSADIGFDLGADYYCAGIVGFETTENSTVEEAMAFYIENIKEYYISTEIKIHEVRNSHGQIMLFAHRKGGNEEKFLLDLRIGMEKMCLSMKQYHNVKAKCALGSIYKSYEKLTKSFQEALDTWRMLLHQERTVHIYVRNAEGVGMVNEDRINEITEELLINIQMGSKKEAFENISQIIDYYGTLSADMAEYISISLVKMVFKISDVMEKHGAGTQAWNDQRVISYLKRHFTYGSLPEAKTVLEEYIEKCCECFRKMNVDNSDRLIRNVKFVIEQNLGNEEFSLDTLSETLHYSSNYIRQLFKSRTGENFSDYLFRKRMELAGTMLRNPTYKIQKIAEETGYSNQRYFTRCFKKYYDMTPTEYREKSL